jgi:hypothetical protein
MSPSATRGKRDGITEGRQQERLDSRDDPVGKDRTNTNEARHLDVIYELGPKRMRRRVTGGETTSFLSW